MRPSIPRKVISYTAACAVLLVGWAALAAAIDSPALPGPIPAFTEFAATFASDLATHLFISGWRVLASTALGTVIAVPLGLWLGRSPRADAVAAPLIFLTYPIPKVVFLPIFILLLGLGDASKIALISLIVGYQILVTARDAARSIPAASVLSVRSLGASGLQVLRHVVFPAALPDIFTALRIGTGTAVAVLFLAESVAGSDGLGYYIVDSWGRIDYDAMFAGVLGMALLGVLIYEALEVAEARACRWTRVGR
ncbi:MAG: ABC transporter permease [Actinobacteria bacterium HGW-Actinobacteria-9]|jgi:NitT/TauT family transport system permease protein|nr:MAG: ABC transporter permease [Actinobacteria bacterium HGW-Actinobacteria-9]